MLTNEFSKAGTLTDERIEAKPSLGCEDNTPWVVGCEDNETWIVDNGLNKAGRFLGEANKTGLVLLEDEFSKGETDSGEAENEDDEKVDNECEEDKTESLGIEVPKSFNDKKSDSFIKGGMAQSQDCGEVTHIRILCFEDDNDVGT